jgi:hypothetical protein
MVVTPIKPVAVPPDVSNIVVLGQHRRRNLAIYMVFLAGLTMIAYSVAALIFVKLVAIHVFWLGIAAMVNLGLIFTGLLGLLAKRSISISTQGLTINDSDQPSGHSDNENNRDES